MLKTNSIYSSGGYPLRAASTGLWSIIVDVSTGRANLFGDGVMMRLLGLDASPGPRECYEYWFSRIHRDYVPFLGEMITKVITAGQHDEVEYVWLHPKWGEMYVRCGGQIVECQAGMIHTMGYHQDVSELRYLRRHLEETLFRLRALADLGGQGVFEMGLYDGNVQVLSGNAIFREQFGCVADDTMPMLVALNMPGEDREQWLSLFDPQEWEVGKRKHFRANYTHPENGQCWIEITCECFRSENGTVKFVGHSHDMSVRHNHEILLLQAKVKSEEALLVNNARRAADSAPHLPFEIDRKALFPAQHRDGSAACRGAPSLTAMLEDMQRFDAIEAPKVKIRKEFFNLHQELRCWMPVMELWARHKGLSLRVLLDFTLPEYIEADSLRIRQVLCNLCDNAIKFTDSGEILLSIRGTQLEPDAEGRYRIVFMVCDAAYLSHRPQKQLSADIPLKTSKARWAKEVGLDIGSSCHLVRMMGGILTQETTPGKGISFRFALNCNLPGNEFPALKKEEMLPFIKGMRVLLIDGNTAGRNAVSAMLECLGAQCVTAKNERECLDIFAVGQPFDLVLMDMRTSAIQGLDSAAVLRESSMPDAGNIPVIGLFSQTGKKNALPQPALGMDGQLAKPVEEDKLVQCLFMWRGRRPREN